MTFQLKIVLFCVFATVGLGGTFSTPEFLWLASAHTEMYAVCFIVLSMFVTVFVLIFSGLEERRHYSSFFGMVSDIYKQVFAVSLLAFCILPFLAMNAFGLPSPSSESAPYSVDDANITLTDRGNNARYRYVYDYRVSVPSDRIAVDVSFYSQDGLPNLDRGETIEGVSATVRTEHGRFGLIYRHHICPDENVWEAGCVVAYSFP